MVKGDPFEVSKEVYERAKEHSVDKKSGYYYMTNEDTEKYFDACIRWGYGLYNCKVHEEDGKYICTWERGNSCD